MHTVMRIVACFFVSPAHGLARVEVEGTPTTNTSYQLSVLATTTRPKRIICVAKRTMVHDTIVLLSGRTKSIFTNVLLSATMLRIFSHFMHFILLIEEEEGRSRMVLHV